MPISIAAAPARAHELAAFDAALVDAGVADRNLILLSSVPPPGSAVERVDRIADAPGFWGDRLDRVLAQARTSKPGTEVWAGIGWMQDATGRDCWSSITRRLSQQPPRLDQSQPAWPRQGTGGRPSPTRAR